MAEEGVLTLSKLANPSGWRGGWRGEEGAKGSGAESLAGSDEKSPAVMKPRRWNESDDSDRDTLDRFPATHKTQKQNTRVHTHTHKHTHT